MITKDSVSISLNQPFDNNQAVLLANAWLKSQRLPVFDVVPDDVLLAGALIAHAIDKGQMYQGRAEGVVVAKSSKVGEVAVSKTYATGDKGRAISCFEQQALALIAHYRSGSIRVIRA